MLLKWLEFLTSIVLTLVAMWHVITGLLVFFTPLVPRDKSALTDIEMWAREGVCLAF